MLTPNIWNAEVQTSPKLKQIYGKYLRYTWIIFQAGRARSIYLKNEWERMGKYIAGRMMKGKTYFKNLEYQVAARRKRIKNLINEIKSVNFSKISLDNLIKQALKIKKVWTDFELANVYAWHLGGDYYLELLGKKLKISPEDLPALTMPKEKTQVLKFEIDYLKNLKALKNKKLKAAAAAERLADDYGWLPYNYDGPVYWDKKYFLKKLLKEKMSLVKIENQLKRINKKDLAEKNNRFKLLKKYDFTPSELKLIEAARTFGVWIDERKKYDYRLNYIYGLILLELGGRYKLDYKHLKYLFIDELPLAKDRELVFKLAEERIKKQFIVKYDSGKRRLMKLKETKIFLKDLSKRFKPAEIKGQVACRGNKKIYRGVVKVLVSGKEAGKVKNRDFLATAMTTPDYIQAMKKAIGFITDEGGVTCHAAIISREMNKPCIIGTKIATKILHDGDLVEVDADKGIVKIIK